MARYTLSVGFFGPREMSEAQVLSLVSPVLPAGWTARVENVVSSSNVTTSMVPLPPPDPDEDRTRDVDPLIQFTVSGSPSGLTGSVFLPVSRRAQINNLSTATEFLLSLVGPDPSIATPNCDRASCPQKFALTASLNRAADALESSGFYKYARGFSLRPEGEPESTYTALARPRPAPASNTGLLIGAVAGLGLLLYFSRK